MLGKLTKDLEFRFILKKIMNLCNKCENTAKRNAFLKKHAITKHKGFRHSSDYCTHIMSTDKVAVKQHIKSEHEGKR